MAPSPEIPPANSPKREFTPEEENEITGKWYADASFEGRTKAEFDAFRSEVRKATTLDFIKRRDDRDYSRLIYENPHVEGFLAEMTVTDLVMIYENKEVIGLSKEQFQRLLATFGEDVQEKFREGIAMGRLMKDLYGQFTSEELREHSDATFAAMIKEIELQETNTPHQEVTLPGLFPEKKKPT